MKKTYNQPLVEVMKFENVYSICAGSPDGTISLGDYDLKDGYVGR